MTNAFIATASLLLILTVVKALAFLFLSNRHLRKFRLAHGVQNIDGQYRYSIIVPAYNEAVVLGNCIDSLLRQDYANVEIVIVNDGSSDDTGKIARRYSERHASVHYLHQINSGKAAALNAGIRKSSGDVVVCVDADSNLLPDTISNIAASFRDPQVMAVTGNIRIANRASILGRFQAAEYVNGLTLQRQAFAELGCIQVISGALASFRRSAIDDVGLYSNDTLVEDMDVTIALARKSHRVVFNPLAIAYTEGPSTWRDLLKQRQRWTFGGFQVLAKYREMIGSRKYGSMGRLGLPYFLLFPWFDVLTSFVLVSAIGLAVSVGYFGQFAGFLALMLVAQSLLVWKACRMDGSDSGHVLYSLLANFSYSHVLNYVTAVAGLRYLMKLDVGWDKLLRVGANILATDAHQPALVRVRADRFDSRFASSDINPAVVGGHFFASDQFNFGTLNRPLVLQQPVQKAAPVLLLAQGQKVARSLFPSSDIAIPAWFDTSLRARQSDPDPRFGVGQNYRTERLWDVPSAKNRFVENIFV